MNGNMTGEGGRPGVSLTPSGIGQYINYAGCPRYFRLNFFDREIVNERNWYDPMAESDLFAEVGLAFEIEQLTALQDRSCKIIGDEEEDAPITFDETWSKQVKDESGAKTDDSKAVWEHGNKNHLEELIEEAAALDPESDPIVLFQLPMYGQLGVWDISGVADLITLEPIEAGIQSRVLEVKTAWKDKTAHQIQATIYSLLLDDVVRELGFDHKAKAAVINREADLGEVRLNELEYIDWPSRTAEVKRLLKRNGELHDLYKQSFEEVGYRLERKCDSCPYNGICFTKAIESSDPALLNLTQGDQQRLATHGVNRLQELTDLYERDPNTRPIDYDGLTVEDEDVVRTLETEGTLGDRLEDLVQRGQVLRGELDPTYERFEEVQYLKGSGQGKLPDDAPHPSLDPPYERGSLIRVYLYVQKDHVRDRITLLAARINGNKTSPREVVELSHELETGQIDSREEEAELLQKFFQGLFGELHAAAADAGYENRANVHLYFYSRHERDAMMDAVQRQPAAFGSHAIRDLLGLREGIDQRMVSVVHDDVTARLALRYPGTGLVQTVEQMSAFAGDEKHDKWRFSDDEWVIERDGEEIDLQNVFRTGMFERWRPYVEEGDTIHLLLGDENEPRDPDGWYPLHNRYGNQIPLEYIWAATGKLEEVTDISEEGGASSEAFATYRYHDGPGSDPVTPTDVEALALKLCEATEHVERSIDYKNWKLEKEPISVPDLPDFGIPDTSLAEACQEYLDLEYATRRQECLDHYLDPPRQRMQTGDSTIFRVTNVEDAGNWDIRVEGELLYDELFNEPEHVLDSCRIKGGEEGESGSWRVMTKLRTTDDGGFEQVNARYPDYIENSTKATVQRFDRQNRRITVNASKRGGYGNGRYLQWHRDAKLDPADVGDYDTLIQEGDLFILDPYADDWTSHRTYAALERTDSNALYDLFNQAFTDGESDQFKQQFCSPDLINDFLDLYKEKVGQEPLGRQKQFVREVDHAVSVLQGPPGTGKTSYTLAPAILARLWAAEQDDRQLVTVVTAPSHTAVDEALEDTAERWHSFHDATGELSNASFLRVASEERALDPLPNVEFLSYYDDRDVDRVASLLESHVNNSSDNVPQHLVIFATTPSLRGIINKVAGPVFGADSAEDVMSSGEAFVDLLAIDEASMLDLPQTLLASAYLSEDAQTLLIGDHRQMEPVQQHDWNVEDRRTIEENVPFMSALNFVRFLRGDLDEVEFAIPTSPEIRDAIPITRLDRTYRLHKLVADLLTDLVYTDDGIRLRSQQEDVIPPITHVTDGVSAAMNPECPVALILHDEKESQDANRTEVAIVRALLQAIPEDNGEEIGVVTPHNAQKGRLVESVGDRVTADTVERFQGGERDVMFISATASDPDYVRSEAEFLLDPNRLNVAMSRMKKKLVIIASESVFRVTPADADQFDQTLIWKRLYDALGITDENPEMDAWTGELSDLCPDSVTVSSGSPRTNIEIYTLQATSKDN